MLDKIVFVHKPVDWWMIQTGRPGWLAGGFTKAGMDERILHMTTTDSERQIMLVRLPCWAHQQPTAWPIGTERKLHNNDCSTLPEDSARTTTIHLSVLPSSSWVQSRLQEMKTDEKWQTESLCSPPPHPPTHTQLFAPGNPERDLWDCVQSFNAKHSSLS